MTPKARAIRDLTTQVRQTLLRDWNILGHAPTDDYDCCAGAITAMVWRGESAEAITTFLDKQTVGHFGSPTPDGLNAAVASRLSKLK